MYNEINNNNNNIFYLHTVGFKANIAYGAVKNVNKIEGKCDFGSKVIEGLSYRE